ncbi:MAG: dTDP-4-dehydrorhamnose 3,5-epimerase family protein [Patescibacteria group bacterium]|jgi:dTDP-4-dehydrorhamnose 3,5-epimerase-like enzyme
MHASEITVDWLKNQKFEIKKDLTIDGVYLKELESQVDGRGDVIELWSEPWVDGQNIIKPKHVYQSATDYGVVKCWHLHQNHTDQFTVTRGKLQVSLVDLRGESPTFLEVNTIFLGTQKPRFLKIPAGIMHGWKALSQPEVIVVNFQSEVYEAQDEYKFPWDCILKEVWQPRNG